MSSIARSSKQVYNLLYIAFVAVILVGDFIAIPIQTRPMPYVLDAYNAINALPEGSFIWYDVTGWPYSYYTALYSNVPVLKHIIQKNLKLVGWGGLGPMITMHDKIMAKAYGVASVKEWPKYGTYLVDLGIPPGLGVGGRLGIVPLMALANKWTDLIQVDMFGTPLGDLPLTKEFFQGKQAKIVFTNNMAFRSFMPAGTKYVSIYSSSTGVVYDTVNSWYAGLLTGFLAGIKQGGQYEILTGIPGDSSRLLLAETLAGGFIIAGMIVGNVLFLVNRFGFRKGQVAAKVKEAERR